MSFENEEEEVLGEAASEVELHNSVTVDSEEEVEAIDVPVPRSRIMSGALELI